MNQNDFNARFVWIADKRLWDSWRRLRGNGPLKGDCDDYAVTSLYIATGGWFGFWKALITFRACFWFTRLRPGQLHMMIWHKNHGWIDNAHPQWGPRALPKLFPVPWPIVVIKLAMGLFHI